jgi:hypothetical protein
MKLRWYIYTPIDRLYFLLNFEIRWGLQIDSILGRYNIGYAGFVYSFNFVFLLDYSYC